MGRRRSIVRVYAVLTLIRAVIIDHAAAILGLNWVEADGLLELGVGVPALANERMTQVVVRVDRVGFQADGLLQLGVGVGVPALVKEHNTQGGVRVAPRKVGLSLCHVRRGQCCSRRRLFGLGRWPFASLLNGGRKSALGFRHDPGNQNYQCDQS